MNRQRSRHTGAARVTKPKVEVGSGGAFGNVHPAPPGSIHNPIRRIVPITTPYDPKKPDPRAIRG